MSVDERILAKRQELLELKANEERLPRLPWEPKSTMNWASTAR